MKLKDNIDFIGSFSITTFDKDGNKETYEDKNLIMDGARYDMAELVGGKTTNSPINRITLGNKGHDGEDVLTPKLVDVTGDFVSSRTMLFSEDPLFDEANNKASFVYDIFFNPVGANNVTVDNSADGRSRDGTDSNNCIVTRTISSRTCTYEIVIPDYAGNKPGEDEVVAYTEAALYAGDRIFSMKTFPARVKENTVKMIISWSIIF